MGTRTRLVSGSIGAALVLTACAWSYAATLTSYAPLAVGDRWHMKLTTRTTTNGRPGPTWSNHQYSSITGRKSWSGASWFIAKTYGSTRAGGRATGISYSLIRWTSRAEATGLSWAASLPNYKDIFSPPYMIGLPKSMVKGRLYSFRTNWVYNYRSTTQRSGYVIQKFKWVANQDVRVPARTFRNCLKITRDLTWHFNGSSTTVRGVSSLWHAKNVGVVKDVSKATTRTGTTVAVGTSTSVLVDYRVR